MGEEKYSKEAFNEATKEAKNANKPFEGSPGQYKGYKYKDGPYFQEYQVSAQQVFENALHLHNEDARITKERAEKLFNTGKKEAVGINEEYNRRIEKFIKEVEDFSSFAVNELGMKRGQARESFKEIINYVLEDTINDVDLENIAKKE